MPRTAHPFAALHNAAVYVRRFRNRPFVVKLGGDILEDEALCRSVCGQLALLWSFSIPLVIVHGGGTGLDALCERLGLPTEKVEGRRVTPPGVLDAAKMAFKGRIQMGLLAALQAAGLPAVGISGQDAGLVKSTRRSPVPVDYGMVGDVASVDPALLKTLLDGGFVPVVAPFSATEEGEVLNTNADTVAAEIAAALGVEKLFFILKVPGLMRDLKDASSLVPLADLATLEELKPVIQGGMKPKIAAAKRALAAGVGSVHLVSGSRSDAILAEVFTNEGSGTMIVSDKHEVAP
ncbi:acetylglutamate kinase [Mesoterricola sediminis]|uniref:Acetylglutamate kinase n=1 Tax=Mesoterricola sediminis TaxID=2927980 RepID=A0AA48KD64_9BACT|nr:acetylglutamate kinase [Mesoterricola sediminis]BDU77929.1 acetylglutamate kinase [Mesoterricola sediminis]